MNIRDHGVWERYKPQNPPVDAPPNTMFSRRASDSADWYDYSRTEGRFATASVKMTIVNGCVAAATRDPSELFPGNSRVLEVLDAASEHPQRDFGGKVYDEARKAFKDPPPMPDLIGDVLKRLATLEGKKP